MGAESYITILLLISLTAYAQPNPSNVGRSEGEYNLIPISVAILVLYALTYVLSRIRKIGIATHRRIWNVVLLMTFLVCGITGLLVAARIDLKWDVPFSALISFWHIETGIAMTFVALLHVIWHWKYFLDIMGFRKR